MGREEKLKGDFNTFWNNSFSTTKEDYYSKLSLSSFLQLKKALSCINNIITLKTTLSFIDSLHRCGVVSDEEASAIKGRVQGTSANTNGYDVEYSENGHFIIAEVKCNIPVGGDSFGAAQERSIVKDLDGLADVSKKSKSKIVDSNQYLKFFVLLEMDGVRDAMQKIMDSYDQYPLQEFQEGNVRLQTNVIYIVYIPT